MYFIFKKFLIFLISLAIFIVVLNIFKPIFATETLIFPYAIHPFDIAKTYPKLWLYLKIIYSVNLLFTIFIILNTISKTFHFHKKSISSKTAPVNEVSLKNSFNVLIGNNSDTKKEVFISEKGLYQNLLITGTIGSGKTSSAMYPILNQLMNCKNYKFGMLILDVKGNFFKQVLNYAKIYDRLSDIIVISLNSNVKYNPLDKPNLKPSVLANRLKTILELFSPNNSESYWLDKVQDIIAECIKLCRLYNNGYVTFTEIHNLVNYDSYYKSKIEDLRTLFQSGKMSNEDVYNLYSSLNFFENEFTNLDERTKSILKSEITRITGVFVSDFQISNIFCPNKEHINFSSFDEVINDGKIVVLNMNIAEYKNLSKIIAAYLKLDFQSEVLSSIAKNKSTICPTVFMCDEYHEYVTISDADFFAQSRESKCINIVSTQSYSSILNTIQNEASVKVIIQNLVNKLWLRTDDMYTIESAQKQIGREDKTKISKNISENASETSYNYFTNSLNSKKSNLSETISTQIQTDFIYDTNFFTQDLKTFSCLAFLSNGNQILPPCKLNLIPYFKSPNKEKKEKNNLKII